MKIKFIVIKPTHEVVARPCDNDTTLEQARVFQPKPEPDSCANDIVVAAISERQYSPAQLTDDSFLEALADAFKCGMACEREVQQTILTGVASAVQEISTSIR